jgi:nucleoside-diphosphate-sugar epimerase
VSINKVLVTGSDGLIGRYTVQELLNHDYKVTPADIRPTQEWNTQIVDFEDLGQVVGVMQGHDAVIHLAAIPTPSRHTADVVFRNNVITAFNVLEAATILGIKNVVMASSLSALGSAWRHRDFEPVYIPIDEPHPLLSQDCYGLSKMIGEELADGYIRRIPDMSIKSLRFTAVIEDEPKSWMKTQIESSDDDIPNGAFWTYVDVRDTAMSCRLAMEYDVAGHEAFYITAPNTHRNEPVEELIVKHYPGNYPIADHIKGSVSPVDCSKAERLLGWKARYNWDGKTL